MMLKQITNSLMKASLLLNKNIYTCFTLDPMIKHYAQINMRSLRRKFLKQSVLNHSKNVIWAQKRQVNQSVIDLKNQGKCVGVIQRHGLGKEQQVDVILPGKIVKGLKKNNNNGLLTVYIRVEGQQYRCILDDIFNHHEGWIAKVILKQYVPNKPNKLKVPIQITHYTDNPYVQKGSQFEVKAQTIDIICFNEEYPLKLYADVSYACPQRPYRIGDLANTFPPGIILDPQANPNIRIMQINPPEKIQLHMKKKLMKTYMASTKKQKVAPNQAATGGTTGSAPGSGSSSGSGGSSTGGSQAKK